MRIVGVMMLRDEDIYCEQAARNIREFCDEIIVIDNGSTDNTLQNVQAAGVDRIIHEPDLRKTHEYVVPYCGTDTWVFGVDGDELYDPIGLRRMKSLLVSGEYDEAYQLCGLFLHVASFSKDHSVATGYPGPPSRAPTKLYNFARMRWYADGKHILFQARPRHTTGLKIRVPGAWDDSPLRCLHMRFFKRSSIEPKKTIGKRLHGENRLGFGLSKDGGKSGVNRRSVYRKGELANTETALFFGDKGSGGAL